MIDWIRLIALIGLIGCIGWIGCIGLIDLIALIRGIGLVDWVRCIGWVGRLEIGGHECLWGRVDVVQGSGMLVHLAWMTWIYHESIDGTCLRLWIGIRK